MTHAALKDLLPADVLRQEVSMMEASLAPYSSPAYRESTERKISAFNAAIAALSAMEGEVVAWSIEQRNGLCRGGVFRDKQEAIDCGVYDPEIDVIRPLIYGATPPAHQPGEAAKSRVVGVDYGSSDQTSYAINCPCGRLHDITAAIAALAPKEAGHG